MAVVLVFFFLSGATSLGYELLWLRHLQLIFGSSTLAVSTVVASFMAGLSLGAYGVGRYVRKSERFLTLYGVLELGIGLYGLLSLFLLNFSDRVFHFYAGFWTSTPLLFHGLRIFHALLILLVPTACMGATLPVLTRWFAARRDRAGRYLSLLYGVNTLGAAAGTLITGFIIIPRLGTFRNLVLLAIVNLVVGLGAVALQRVYPRVANRRPPAPSQVSPSSSVESTVAPPATEDVTRLQMVLFLSGAAAMLFEVIWTRILEAFVYNTVYSFTTILMAFLLGVGAGSLYFQRKSFQQSIRWRTVARVQLLLAAFGFLGWAAFDRYIPEVVLWVHLRWPENLTAQTWAVFIVSSAFIFAPTFFMGLNFPLVTHLIVLRRARIVRDVGESYAYTTWGNILGSLGAGLVVIPIMGLQGGYRFALLLTLLAAWIVLFPAWKRWETILLLLFAGLVLGYPGISPYVMDSGIYARPRWYSGNPEAFRILLRRFPMGFYREGQHANVSVRYDRGKPSLRINGKPEASLEPIDQRSQKLAAYLPLMLQPQPRRVLVVGLGGGITPAAFARDPRVHRLDIVEIEPAVRRALQAFEFWTQGLLKNPKIHWIFEDGRGFLNRIATTYDTISLHVSPGVTTFYSVEFYRLAAHHLAANGILVQWFHTWQTDFTGVRIAVRTVGQVFPYYEVFCDGPSLFIMASKEPVRLEVSAWPERLRRHPDALRDLWEHLRMVSPYELMAYRIGNEKSWKPYVDDVPIHSDVQPVLEYAVARNFYLRNTEKYVLRRLFRIQDMEENLKRLEQSGLSPADAALWMLSGYLTHFVPDRAREFRRMIEQRIPDLDHQAPCLAAKAKWVWRMTTNPNIASPEKLFEELSEACRFREPLSKDGIPSLVWVSALYATMNRWIPPQRVLEQIYPILVRQGRLTPKDWEAWVNLEIQSRNRRQVLFLFRTASKWEVPPWRVDYWRGEWERVQHHSAKATLFYRRAIQVHPYDPKPYQRLAEALERARKDKMLMRFLSRYLNTFPTDLEAWLRYARTARRLKDERTFRVAIGKAQLLATTMEEKTQVYELLGR